MDRLDSAGVTPREREVLALLGERLTNAEIANDLYISVRTVESHVSSLLNKLGADNRRDLAEFSPAANRRGFPVPHTSLIGREGLLDHVEQVLGEQRMMTLSGVGGSGKTRMAIEIGNRVASGFRNGAVFVDLVPVSGNRFVAATVAKSLGIVSASMGSTGSKEDEVINYLSKRETLVVLDNCEHVIRGAAGLVERVLTECPETKILTTSRQGFGIPGESIISVPPLELPNGQTQGPVEAESVRLIVERAEAVRSGLDLLGSHRGAVVEICRRLDGIPLAIELAAVQFAHLTPEDVATRLDDRFGLLGGRRASAPPKSTLQTAIGWSYELLSEPERSVFNRVGVFAGGFSLEAAEAVCWDVGTEGDPVSEILGSLVWKSLILATPDKDHSRFRMLETLHAYALERLGEIGEGDEIRARHCTWFSRLVEEAAPHLTKGDTGAWLTRLDQDLGNLRAALAWAIEMRKTEQASQLVVGLWHYWHMRGDIEEGRRWAAEVLALGGEDAMTRARTLEAAGGLAYWGGAMEESRQYYQEALGLLREHGSDQDVANALYNASFAYGFGGQTEPALRHAEEARKIYEDLGDEEGAAKSMWGWGASAHAGGRDQEAVVAYRRALSIYEKLDDSFMLGWIHRMLGRSLLQLNELEAARPHLDSGIETFDAVGDVSGVILHLRDYAELAMRQNNYERAVTLAGSVRALEDESGLNLLEGFSEQLEGLGEAREALGADRAEQLFDRGREMSRSEAIRYAVS